MKTRFPLLAFFSLFAFYVNAQSDYSSYLNKAMEKLEVGDCDDAQKWYNVYKELSGESKPSVQVLIDDCKNAKVKKYSIGEELKQHGCSFKVAYLDSSNEHGFAIYERTSSSKFLTNSDKFYYDAHLITLSELSKIIPNRHLLGLRGSYWTATVAKSSNNDKETKYYVKNVETGNEKSVVCCNGKDGSYYLLYVIAF